MYMALSWYTAHAQSWDSDMGFKLVPGRAKKDISGGEPFNQVLPHVNLSDKSKSKHNPKPPVNPSLNVAKAGNSFISSNQIAIKMSSFFLSQIWIDNEFANSFFRLGAKVLHRIVEFRLMRIENHCVSIAAIMMRRCEHFDRWGEFWCSMPKVVPSYHQKPCS